MAQLITSASIEISMASRLSGRTRRWPPCSHPRPWHPKSSGICTVMAIVSCFIWLIHVYTTNKNGDDWGMLYQYGEITAYDDKQYSYGHFLVTNGDHVWLVMVFIVAKSD